jgi:hypothetical protein
VCVCVKSKTHLVADLTPVEVDALEHIGAIENILDSQEVVVEGGAVQRDTLAGLGGGDRRIVLVVVDVEAAKVCVVVRVRRDDVDRRLESAVATDRCQVTPLRWSGKVGVFDVHKVVGC